MSLKRQLRNKAQLYHDPMRELLLTAADRIEILEHRLKDALRCMKEAKRLHFSNTTNSDADDLINSIEDMFDPPNPPDQAR